MSKELEKIRPPSDIFLTELLQAPSWMRGSDGPWADSGDMSQVMEAARRLLVPSLLYITKELG